MKKEESYEPCFDDFEPFCKLTKKQESSISKETDILEIQLPGFKKEELKLELGKDGFLRITGEHPTGRNITKRFNKKIDVSQHEMEGVEPDFENGILRIMLPRKRSAIRFRFGRDKESVEILLSGPQIFKKTTYCVVVLALLFLLVAIYVYKYYDCTQFLKWFE